MVLLFAFGRLITWTAAAVREEDGGLPGFDLPAGAESLVLRLLTDELCGGDQLQRCSTKTAPNLFIIFRTHLDTV